MYNCINEFVISVVKYRTVEIRVNDISRDAAAYLPALGSHDRSEKE